MVLAPRNQCEAQIAQLVILNQQLQTFAGEMILADAWEHVCTKHVFMSTPYAQSTYEWRRELKVGVVSKDFTFDCSNGNFRHTCTIPVLRYVQFNFIGGYLNPNMKGVKVLPDQKMFFFDSWFVLAGNEPDRSQVPVVRILRIFVGNDAVRQALTTISRLHGDTAFVAAGVELGILDSNY